MTIVKAKLSNHRQSPRKVRLVADVVRGKNAGRAIAELSFLPKKASLPVKKLIVSAIANAKNNFNLKEENLFIKSIEVNEGATMKRWRAGWRGTAFPIKKRTSHISVILEEK